MKRNRFLLTSAVFLAAAIGVRGTAVDHLPSLPGFGEPAGAMIELAAGQAEDVNQWGEITGLTLNPEGMWRAYLTWPHGTVHLLGTLGGHSMGFGMNDYGDVVGESGIEQVAHAFRQRGDDISDLGIGEAVDINNGGVTAGWTTQAVVWGPSARARPLSCPWPPPTQWWWSAASGGINDRGQVAGWCNDETGVPHAMRWEADGTVKELGIGVPLAINQAGDVTGWGRGIPGFLWTQGTGWMDIWDLQPTAINDTGQLAGICANGTSFPDACTWSATAGVVRLPKPVPGYGRAEAINDFGEVVGTLSQQTGPGHALWWYAPPPVADQLATTLRLIELLHGDGVLAHGRETALLAAFNRVERAWHDGDAAKAAAAMEHMARLLDRGKHPPSVRNRLTHLDALLRRLALRLRAE